MNKMTYAQQLAHPLWQRRRLEMLSAAGWKCTCCGSSEKTLHVHHKQYFKGRMAWEYVDAELQVLCDECHEKSHVLDTRIKTVLARVPQEEALALLVGYFGCAYGEEYDQCYSEQPEIVEIGGLASCLRGQPPELVSSVWDMIVKSDMERCK